MTTKNSSVSDTSNAYDPLLRPAHLAIATGLGEAAIVRYIQLGKIPPADLRGQSAIKLWRLSTIRAWNPDIADSIELLLQNPAFPASGRYCSE